MASAGHGFHCDGNVDKFCLFSFLRRKRFFYANSFEPPGKFHKIKRLQVSQQQNSFNKARL